MEVVFAQAGSEHHQVILGYCHPSKFTSDKSSLALALQFMEQLFCEAKTKYSNPSAVLKGYFYLLKHNWSITRQVVDAF